MERHFGQERLINNWLMERFGNIPTAYIRMNLLYTPQYTDKHADAIKTTAIFRNQINQYFFGKKVRRFGKGLKITAAYHKHWRQQPHIHLISEIPNGKTIQDLRDFAALFVRSHRYVSSDIFIEETKAINASIAYNNRFGEHSLLHF